MAERRYDIDWLRIIAMVGIFLLHCMHLFDLDTDWHLRNADQSVMISALRGVSTYGRFRCSLFCPGPEPGSR